MKYETLGESEWLNRDPVWMKLDTRSEAWIRQRTKSKGESHSSVSQFEGVVVYHGMLSMSLIFLSGEEQRRANLKQCMRGQGLGCYGRDMTYHGSDEQSILTYRRPLDPSPLNTLSYILCC